MLQFLGIPLILAAWTLPALFLLTLAALFTYAALRPVYVAWVAVVDAVAGWTGRQLASAAASIATRSYAYVARHGQHLG